MQAKVEATRPKPRRRERAERDSQFEDSKTVNVELSIDMQAPALVVHKRSWHRKRSEATGRSAQQTSKGIPAGVAYEQLAALFREMYRRFRIAPAA